LSAILQRPEKKESRAAEGKSSGSSAIFIMKTRRFPPPPREGLGLVGKLIDG